MAKRQVIALTSTSPGQDGFPLTLLNKMGEHLAHAVNEAYLLTYHHLDRHDYWFKQQPGSSESLSEVIKYFYPNGNHSHLRAVLSQVSGTIDFDPGENHKNLVYSVSAKEGKWAASDGKNISAAIELPSSKMALLVFDLLLDISFANSNAVKPIIDRYLLANSRQSLYKSKVQYIKSKKLPLSPIYGALAEDAQYISFSAIARRSQNVCSAEHLLSTAQLWDDFTNNNLSNFRASSRTIIKELQNIPHYGKQFSPRVFRKQKIENGNVFIVRPKSSLRIGEARRNGLAAIFGIPDWSPRHSFAICQSDLSKDESRRKNLNICVRSNLAMVFRMYYGGE